MNPELLTWEEKTVVMPDGREITTKGYDDLLLAGLEPIILRDEEASRAIEQTVAMAREAETAEVLDQVTQLIERARDDVGAAFERDALRDLGTLRARDAAAFERAWGKLKRAGVRMRELERRLPPSQPRDEQQRVSYGDQRTSFRPAALPRPAMIGKLPFKRSRRVMNRSSPDCTLAATWRVGSTPSPRPAP
jgi:hypothetical protein